MAGEPAIAFIGTGIMGVPMARNLMRAGYALTVYNRTRSKAEGLIREGACWAESPAAAAANSPVVISIVSDSPDVESVYLGRAGVCEGLQSGTLCIDMSTIAPGVARAVAAEVEKRGGSFMDAPVSGGKMGAEAGTLSVMVGADAADVSRARPILAALGKHIVHTGPVGSGQTAKLCNQIVCGLNLLAVSEAMVFAKKAGLDLSIMLQAISKGAAASWVLDNLGPRMLARDFAPMFMVDLHQKDLRIVLSTALANQAPLPGTSLVSQLLAANQAAGEGSEGTQALVKTIERMAQVT